MSKSIDDLLQSESDAIEANPDAPIGPKTTVTRGHDRVKKLQIRLNDDEYDLIEQLARAQGIPASTMARSLLLSVIGEPTTATKNPSDANWIDAIAGRIARMSKDLAFVQSRFAQSYSGSSSSTAH